MPAVSKGDGMRGLAVFISDIRNCKYIILLMSVVVVISVVLAVFVLLTR